ncbi:MAG TPA: hypothetical protein VKQ72_19510 [Aggregatilineales bacterium]|nr:hypothetical protein [Aggregatilineales bacterium]
MSALTDLDDARQTLRQLTLVALDANRALFDGLQHPAEQPSQEQSQVLNRIRENLMPMREGFMLVVRMSDLSLVSELRALLDILVDWHWLEELGLHWEGGREIERPKGQIVLYQHAVIAFGMLPRLPRSAVTYPFGQYTDIPVPKSPGETLNRLEELEQTIFAAASEPMAALPRGALRRTYGFFDATTWLIATHLRGIVDL